MSIRNRLLSPGVVGASLLMTPLGGIACAEYTPEQSSQSSFLEAEEVADDGGITSNKISVVRYSQQPYGNLCWATCIAMVASYFNSDSVNRTLAIAQSHFGTTEESGFNRRLPSASQEVSGEMVQRYTQDVSFLNEEVYVPPGRPGSADPEYKAISYDLIKLYIDLSFPIIAAVPGSISLPGGMHDVVIVGYREHDGEKYVIYNDPWDGNEHEMAEGTFKTAAYITFYRGSEAPQLPTPPEPLNDSFKTAKALNPPTTLEMAGHLGLGEERYYTFTAPAYATYTISSLGTTDTVGTLYAGDQSTILATNDDANGTTNFSMELTSAGRITYYIKVRHFSPLGGGDFGLSISMK